MRINYYQKSLNNFDMNSEKWNELCFLLSDKININISENDFEQNVLHSLRVLNWKEYLGDIDVRPSFQIGASNRIIPDFVIKDSNEQKLFVIEIKQPNLQLNSNFQQQLFSYMRQLKLEFGILIGQGIQIFYDGSLSQQEDPILLDTIKFEKDNKKGIRFTQLFDKENYTYEALEEFTKESLKRIDKKKDFKILTNKILSSSFKENINRLIKQEFIGEYDGELVDSVLNNLKIEIHNKNLIQSVQQPNVYVRQENFNVKKFGVIESIKNAITSIPQSQEDILKRLIVLFPNRRPDSMRNTVRAQLGGKKQPVRIEREKNISLVITYDSNGLPCYSIKSGDSFIEQLSNSAIDRSEMSSYRHNIKEKIGKHIQKQLRSLYEQNLLTNEDINDLQKKDFSRRVFNQSFEVLRNHNREIKDTQGRNRYYSKELFCGNYYLTSQWSEHHREPFNRWLNSILNK